MPRLFLAARAKEVPREVRGLLADLQGVAGCKPVAPENLHVTLRFLGDVDHALVPALAQALERAAGGQAAIKASLGGLGAFPHAGRPRVLWIATDADAAEALTALADEVDAACDELDVGRRDKPFVAHLTVGRVKDPAEPAIQPIMAAHGETPHGVVVIKGVQLVASVLTPKGPRYEDLVEVTLA